jgi:membrane-associated phospholipid phosphatase
MISIVLALVCVMVVAPSNQNAPSTLDASGSVTAAAPLQVSPDQDGTLETKADFPDVDKPPTPPHTGWHAILVGLEGDISHLPSATNLNLLGMGSALALGLHPLDHTVNARLVSHYDLVNTFFAPAKYLGDTPEQLAFSIGTWAIGRRMHKPKMSHLGMDLLRAQALTEMLVQPVKFATRRERPDLSNRQSFPSGHAAVTFATAAVIERHLGWRRSLVAYGIASYVAASRLHDNRHYLSDVVFGAAVGSIAGRTVTKHGRDIWTLTPAAVPGGMALNVTRRAL